MPKSKQMYLLTFKIIKLHTYKPIKMKNIYTQLDTKFLHLTTKIAPSFQFIPYKMHILTITHSCSREQYLGILSRAGGIKHCFGQKGPKWLSL